MMNLIFDYCQYRWNSLFIVNKKNCFAHKVSQCLQIGKKNIPFEIELAPFRQQAKSNNRFLQVQDFGAGSKKLGTTRKLSAIYRTSVAPRKNQAFLYHLIQTFQSKNILEMGTSLGFTTMYLGKSSTGKVTTVEACPATAQEAKNLFTQMEMENIQLFNSTFAHFFETKGEQKFDFVFLDGHHDGSAVLQYLEDLKPRLSENAILVLDDIRWSSDMFAAWEKIRSDSFFSDHHDLFRMGILARNFS